MTLHAFQLACTHGDLQLFENINFEINLNEALHVAGTNGSGKTSLSSSASGEAR